MKLLAPRQASILAHPWDFTVRTLKAFRAATRCLGAVDYRPVGCRDSARESSPSNLRFLSRRRRNCQPKIFGSPGPLDACPSTGPLIRGVVAYLSMAMLFHGATCPLKRMRLMSIRSASTLAAGCCAMSQTMPSFKSSHFKRIFMLGALALTFGQASATLIDFNSLATGTVVTNQFAGLTFASEPGQQIVAGSGFVCTGTPTWNCTQDVYIDFAAGAANISIDAIEPNEFGTVATFFLYSGATLLGTQDLIGLASVSGKFGFGTKTVSLGSFSGVTRLEIRGPGGVGDLDNSYGGSGIGWDNLHYDSSPSVPEPGTWSLMLLGALTIGAVKRAKAVRQG